MLELDEILDEVVLHEALLGIFTNPSRSALILSPKALLPLGLLQREVVFATSHSIELQKHVASARHSHLPHRQHITGVEVWVRLTGLLVPLDWCRRSSCEGKVDTCFPIVRYLLFVVVIIKVFLSIAA